MLNRRKRIPYDPPSQRKKKRRRPAPLRADQLFLSRRVLLLKGTIVAAFAGLAARLGYMQIIQGQEYESASRSYARSWEIVKSPRGLIYDRAGRPLAENHRAWEVRVVPADLPTDPGELRRVKETLITALRLPEALVVNPTAVPVGTERTVYGRIASLLGDPDTEWWIDYISRQAEINYLVLVDRSLTGDEAATFRAAAQELPGVQVVNILDYLIGNAGDPRQPVTVKRDVSKEIALTLEANRLYLPGVICDDAVLTRAYPGGEVMSHLLGYVGVINEDEYKDPAYQTEGGNPIYQRDDSIGKDGLERTMEALLRGRKGGRWIERDTLGLFRRVIPGTETPAVPGRNLKLAIDLELQAAASDALQKGIVFSNEDRAAKDRADGKPFKEYDAGAGAVVALDPRTGEVLAMVSYPLYDNTLFLEGISERKYKEYLDERKKKPLVNRAVAAHYPPGSTLKLFIAAGALRDGVLDEGTTFTCTGAIRVPWTWDESKGDEYPCWNKEGHGDLNVVAALERSCDVFFYNVGTPKQRPEGASEDLHYYDYNWFTKQSGAKHYFNGLGIQRITKNLEKRFWFGRQTQVDLPWESPGLVPDNEWKLETWEQGWTSGDTINVSIGQGYFLSTPLQLAVNTAALANGGKIFKPLLVREVVDAQGEKVQRFEPQLLRDMRLRPEYLAIVREGMRRVVHSEDGTANRTFSRESGTFTTKWPLTNPPGEDEIVIAGKTGTAEFGKQNEDGTYEQQHAWFTCYAPFDDPEIVVTVIVEDGGEGSSYAVPVVDRVLRAYFELKGKRPRKVLRADKRPFSEDAPAPNPEDAALEPGTTSSEAQD